MKIMLKSRKGVSPVIAALLLIAISVAAAVITYSWVMTMIDTQGKAAQTAMRIEDVTWTSNLITVITVRNTGAVPVVITTVYIYQGDTKIIRADITDAAILAGATADIEVSTDAPTGPGPLSTSTGYKIKIVSDNGFVIEGTYYTPSAFPD